MINNLKKIVYILLPDNLVNKIKKFYYPIKMKNSDYSHQIEFEIMKYLIQPNDTVIDVGANIGIFSHFFSDITGIGGKVYSFEPIPSTYSFLDSNIKKLKLKNVESFNYAVSNENHTVSMEVPRYQNGGENYYEAHIVNASGDNSNHFTIEAITIDSFLGSRIKSLSFIKYDTEGHELNCIEGSKNLIKSFKPAILTEMSSPFDMENSPSSRILDILKSFDYECFHFDGKNMMRWLNKNELVASSSPDRVNFYENINLQLKNKTGVNFFFLTNLHINQLMKNGVPFK
jgi:FkbM family methyltransferase